MWLATFAPLVIFVAVDFYAGLRRGVLAASITALSACILLWFLTGAIDYEALGAVAVMCVLGWFSVRADKPIFFKLQPVITGCAVVVYGTYLHIFDQPLLVRAWPTVEKIIPAEQFGFISGSEGQAFLATLSLYVIVWTFLHSLLVAWAALKRSNLVWIIVKGLAIPFIFVGSFCTLVVKALLGS
jgi:hypothetical protein